MNKLVSVKQDVDFNLHVDNSNDIYANKYLDLLTTFNFIQHVQCA